MLFYEKISVGNVIYFIPDSQVRSNLCFILYLHSTICLICFFAIYLLKTDAIYKKI